MKKQLIKCMLIAMTLGASMSINTYAEDAAPASNDVSGSQTSDSSIIIDPANNVSVVSPDAVNEGIKAVSVSMDIKPSDENDMIEKVEFEFADQNNAKIAEYRYHEDTGQLNVYMADENTVFRANKMQLGSVKALDANNNKIDIDITLPEQALSMVSKDGSTVSDPVFNNNKAPRGAKNMDVVKEYSSHYIINIPDGTNDFKENNVMLVEANDVQIEPDKVLEVSVKSANGWNLVDKSNDEGSGKLYYCMQIGEDLEVSGNKPDDGNTDSINENSLKSQVILSVSDGRPADSVELTVKELEKATVAGTYSDTLTFTVKVK